MKIRLKTGQAITLISLVVTIIILVMLAGVSINLVLGENGIVTKAKLGKANHTQAQIQEQEMLEGFVNEMDYHIASSTREKFIETELWNGQQSTAGEIQLSDSYENYHSLVFIYRDPRELGWLTSHEILTSTLKFAKETNQYVDLYGFDNYLITLRMLEDTTKIQFVKNNVYELCKIIGLN